MCDFSGKLIAWMDGELPESQVVTIEEHFKDCEECRAHLVSYRQASDGFAAYCDAAVAVSVAEPRRETPRWVLAATGVAATVALLLVLLPKHGGHSPSAVRVPLSSPTAATTANSTAEVRSSGAPAAELSARRAKPVKAKGSDHISAANSVERVVAARLGVQSVEGVPAGPSIEIAIPSDAIFPPGAMPEGMSFVANVTLGPDGSAERLGLRPRITGFERRENQ
jgi:anti-sigma factor RsiW